MKVSDYSSGKPGNLGEFQKISTESQKSEKISLLEQLTIGSHIEISITIELTEVGIKISPWHLKPLRCHRATLRCALNYFRLAHDHDLAYPMSTDPESRDLDTRAI